MKLFSFLLFALLSTAVFAQDKSGVSTTTASFRQLETSIIQAFLNADKTKLNTMLTPDYKEIYEQGRTAHREAIFENMQPHPGITFKDTNMEVNVYGDAAIVTATWEFKGDAAGAKPNYVHLTDVYVRQNGNWKISLSQEDEVPVWRVRTLRDDEFVAATAVNCEEEPNLKSSSSDKQTFMRIKNNSKDPVTPYWIDYNGKRDARAEEVKPILPGQSLDLTTYVTHPFVIVGANNHCLGIYMPAADPSLVSIQ